MMLTSAIGLLFLAFGTVLQASSFPKIYDSQKKSLIELKDLNQQLESIDVLIIGEEHDDLKGHQEKLKLIQELSRSYSICISMEMFETDQQTVLNEYLSNQISEKSFHSSIKLWNNYNSAYRPIIEFAKENNIPVLASNAPDRYVKVISHKGMEGIQKLSDQSLHLLPPLYQIKLYSQKEYEDNFYEMLGMNNHNKPNDNMLLAQYLRDASMSHFIANHFFKNRLKIVHINGRFHSDYQLGVTHRLKSMGLNVLSISMFLLSGGKKIEELYNAADIIYITGER